MDEPFSNLDQRLRETIREQTIALLRDEGISAVVVTHDPEEAMQIADSIALMQAGRIVQTGTPQQLYNHPASLFVARFFCDVNEIEAECRNGQIDCPLGCFNAPPALADGACMLCSRPQDITLDADGVPVEFVSRQFLGHDDRLRLRLPHTGQFIHARLSHTGPLKAGQMLRIGVVPDHLVVFAS